MSCGGGDNDAFAHAVGVIDVNGGGEQIGAGGAVVKGLGAGGGLATDQPGERVGAHLYVRPQRPRAAFGRAGTGVAPYGLPRGLPVGAHSVMRARP